MVKPTRPGPGPTGRFPLGKIRPNDEGELAVAVTYNAKDGLIHLDFAKPVAWLAMPPEDAVKFAELLIRVARQSGQHISLTIG